MNHEPTIDPDQLQQLVDGELSAAGIRALFEIAERNPSLWRQIACSFAEDQLFRKEFEALAESIEPQPAKTAAAAKTEPAGKSQPSMVGRWAIAASLAAASLLGYQFGSGGPGTLPGPSATEMIASHPADTPSDLQNTPAPTSVLTAADLQPEYRVELLTADGEAIDGEVDLYRYDDLHRLVSHRDANSRVTLDDILPPSGFSPKARQRLSQSGYEINESTNFVSGRLQDGRPFVVPVRSIRFDQGH